MSHDSGSTRPAEEPIAEVKRLAAAAHRSDRLACTKAKTPCIQSIVDRARRERGLPLVGVWEE